MRSPPLVLTFLLLLETLLVRHGSGDQCLTSWVSNQFISQQAAYLGELTDVDSKAQWIFPQLRVTCTTTITKLRFIGEALQDGNIKIPELQIWRKDSPTSTRYSKIHHTQEGAVVTVERTNLYAISVSWQVQPGDVFGVYQPNTRRSRYSFAMQERGGGELSYVLRNRKRAPDRFDTSRYDVTGHPYPLVSVEAGDGECTSQFLSLLTVIKKSQVKSGLDQPNTSELYSDSNRVRIFPAIRFGCNGRITQAKFAAEPKESTSSLTSHAELQLWSELQIWFLSIAGSYNQRNRASLEGARATADLNVYEKSLSQPLRFKEDDILGLYLPPEGYSSLQLYLQGGPFTTNMPSYSIQQGNSFKFFKTNNAASDHGVPLLSLEIVADCEQPASPTRGRVTVSSTSSGYLASYQCNDGYKLVGHRERTCDTADGMWTYSDPTCLAVYCEAAPSPANGQVVYANPNQSTAFDSKVTYSCDVGFEVNGNDTRQCTASGNWSGITPTCSGIQCSGPDIPIHGSAVVENATPETQLNARAIYNCSAGHTLVGEKIRVCGEDKTWNGSAPQCIPDCPPPPKIINGVVIVPPWGTPLHTVVEYSCTIGTRMVGNQTIRCLENSKWSGTPPVCKEITCASLKNPKNGVVILRNGTVYRSRAHYNCNSNFFLKGNNSRICQMDGNWSGRMPKCVYREDDSTTPEASISLHPTSTVATVFMVSEVAAGASFVMGAQDTAIAVVIAVLCLIIVCMIIAIAGVYAKKRMKRKRVLDQSMAVAIADLQENLIENPMYGADHRFSFNFWDPHTTPAPPSPDGDDTTLYSNPAYYDCDNLPSTKSPRRTGKSLYYNVSSLLNPAAGQHYEVMDCEAHYEIASNFQFELPALPYEVPTPSSNFPPTIYGSLPWGTYVPTKEGRSSTYSNIPPTRAASTPISLKSHGSVASIQAFFQECEIYWKPASDSASLYEQLAKNRYREILRHQIQITKNLGSGQFGHVVKGLWQSPAGVLPVAVKMLKEGTEESDEVRFLQEAAINGQFQHRNVVKLHGVVTLGRPVMIVLELCPNGDLRDYLIQARPSPGEIMASDWHQRLLQFCKDIACGMEYLSRKAFVHRDLAARNILVAQDKTCKISDFGLSRDLEHESYYISHGGKIPVKWTAPEAIHYKKYSTASDVWSFGCVMYEIWSLGHKPFEEHTNLVVIAMIEHGFRLPPPPGCLRSIYSLMIQCWHPDSSHRPSFSDLFHSLKQLDLNVRHLSQCKKETNGFDQLLQLGAPLDLGKNLYPDLQNLYIEQCSSENKQ